MGELLHLVGSVVAGEKQSKRGFSSAPTLPTQMFNCFLTGCGEDFTQFTQDTKAQVSGENTKKMLREKENKLL